MLLLFNSNTHTHSRTLSVPTEVPTAHMILKCAAGGVYCLLDVLLDSFLSEMTTHSKEGQSNFQTARFQDVVFGGIGPFETRADWRQMILIISPVAQRWER